MPVVTTGTVFRVPALTFGYDDPSGTLGPATAYIAYLPARTGFSTTETFPPFVWWSDVHFVKPPVSKSSQNVAKGGHPPVTTTPVSPLATSSPRAPSTPP